MSPGRETRRRDRGGLGPETTRLLLGLAVIGAGLAVWAALSLGSLAAGDPVTLNPTAGLLELAFGTRGWPWQSSVVLAGEAALVTAVVVQARRHRGRTGGVAVDAAARTMQRPSGLRIARVRDNAAQAGRLLKDAPPEVRARKGPLLGYTVAGNIALHVPVELGVFIEAGTRTGKTMVWAIPAVLGAWGPVMATSNRPDLYRHTCAARRTTGRVWLLDPQAVTGTVGIGFWVNLLASIETLSAARKLASFFVSASKEKDAKVDSYFDGGAQELLALHILAAACAEGDLFHVMDWLGADQDQTPALILRRAGKQRAANRILDAQSLYARQRDGLYDMARRFLNVLADEVYATMALPPRRRVITAHDTGDTITVANPVTGEIVHQLPEFDPWTFVTSTDTLYALSMQGPDSAAPLSAALIGQILEAAMSVARARPDGRLAVPLLAVLDEAANCCPIAALPDYYTYAGGHGVILMTFLQVLEQGEELWGPRGLKIIRAQAIEVYGGGISEDEFLQHWSRISDDHEVADYSHSHGPGGRNRTVSWRTEPNLSAAELSALPKSRALVRLPGHQPVLVRKIAWPDTEYADQIRASLAEFDDPDNPPEILAGTGFQL